MPSAAEAIYPGGPNTALGNEQQNYGMLSEEEWQAWRQLPVKKGRVFAPKNHEDLLGMLDDNPDGFTVHPGNPNIKSILDQADVLRIPGHDSLFIRPKVKPPLTS